MMRYLLDKFYALKPPQRSREDGQRPMRVLALGLSRSGTDSLRNALLILGYANVYHGWVLSRTQRADCAFWYPHLKAKIRQLSTSSTTEIAGLEFDSVLGNSEAITDAPANVFGIELMQYYPNAKVILNRRRDIDAWHRSMLSNVMPGFGWSLWILSFFDSGLYWLWAIFHLSEVDYFDGDLVKYGRKGYMDHYRRLEVALKANKRDYLDWNVEDGWYPSLISTDLTLMADTIIDANREPLCKFLDRPIPDTPFPHGNRSGSEFEMNFEKTMRGSVNNAMKNIGITVAGSILIVSAAVWKAISL